MEVVEPDESWPSVALTSVAWPRAAVALAWAAQRRRLFFHAHAHVHARARATDFHAALAAELLDSQERRPVPEEQLPVVEQGALRSCVLPKASMAQPRPPDEPSAPRV
jgi:hypothetical protein